MPHASHLRPVESVDLVDASASDHGSETREPDPVWVQRAIAGDTEAWAALYAERYPSLFRQLRYLTGDDALAEELAQETFARAIAGARLHTFAGVGHDMPRPIWREAIGHFVANTERAG